MAFEFKQLPKTHLYEFGVDNRTRNQALNLALADVKRAAALGIAVKFESVTWKAFRGGGNINKATCVGFQVTFQTEPTEQGDDF